MGVAYMYVVGQFMGAVLAVAAVGSPRRSLGYAPGDRGLVPTILGWLVRSCSFDPLWIGYFDASDNMEAFWRGRIRSRKEKQGGRGLAYRNPARTASSWLR
jgi:hypothetical protein